MKRILKNIQVHTPKGVVTLNVLIDTGANTNGIHSKWIEGMETTPLGIKQADNSTLENASSVTKKIKFKMDNRAFEDHFATFPSAPHDCILGIC
jgi:hypothetical protein